MGSRFQYTATPIDLMNQLDGKYARHFMERKADSPSCHNACIGCRYWRPSGWPSSRGPRHESRSHLAGWMMRHAPNADVVVSQTAGHSRHHAAMRRRQAAKGCLIVSNHISWVDIFAINALYQRPSFSKRRSETGRQSAAGQSERYRFLRRRAAGPRTHRQCRNRRNDGLREGCRPL